MLIKFIDRARLGNTVYFPQTESINEPKEVWYMVKILFLFIQLEKFTGEKS